MIRLLARLALSFLANAFGLYMAKVFVDGFSIDGIAFITAVIIFTIATTILGPLVVKVALTSAPYLMGGIALVTTFVALLVTNLLSDGISITGVSAWVISTLVVWVCSVIGSVVLPLLLFKKVLSKDTKK